MISNGSFIEQILPRGSELKLRGGRLKLINSRSGLHITVFCHRAQTWWLSDNGWHFRIDIHWLNWQYGTVKKKKIFLWHNDLAKPLGSGPCLTPCYKWLCSNIFCRDQYQIIHNLFDLFFFFTSLPISRSITPFFYCSSTGWRLSICRLPHRQGLEETVRSSAFCAPSWPRQTTEGRGGHRQHFGPSRQNPGRISITLPRKMALL